MKRALVLLAASTVLMTACGTDSNDAGGTPAEETRTIEVVMTDMAFTPNAIDAKAGETVKFVFRNDGAVRHEAYFGGSAEQEAHHAEMAAMGGEHEGMDMDSMPEHSAGAGAAHMVVVEPGETVELTHTFGDAPTMIGCHQPGHWEAGMKMDIDV